MAFKRYRKWSFKLGNAKLTLTHFSFNGNRFTIKAEMDSYGPGSPCQPLHGLPWKRIWLEKYKCPAMKLFTIVDMWDPSCGWYVLFIHQWEWCLDSQHINIGLFWRKQATNNLFQISLSATVAKAVFEFHPSVQCKGFGVIPNASTSLVV